MLLGGGRVVGWAMARARTDGRKLPTNVRPPVIDGAKTVFGTKIEAIP
jgi:hypothetical protein